MTRDELRRLKESVIAKSKSYTSKGHHFALEANVNARYEKRLLALGLKK